MSDPKTLDDFAVLKLQNRDLVWYSPEGNDTIIINATNLKMLIRETADFVAKDLLSVVESYCNGGCKRDLKERIRRLGIKGE